MPASNVTLLTNFVAPYRLPLFRALSSSLCNFRVLVSLPMEANRPWSVEFRDLNVETQKTLTFRRPWKHPHGFYEQIYVHVPYDTLLRLSRLKPQVVLSAELGTRTLQAVIYRRLHRRSRLIIWATVSEYSENGRGRFREFLRRRLLPHADGILVNGSSGARYMKRFGVPDDKIFVVPYTTDICKFSAVPLVRGPAAGRRILYVGQLIERKGLVRFLSSLSRWAKAHPLERLEFWAVGDGPIRDSLGEMIAPPNLAMRFWGNVDYQELPTFYAQAGILAFPTLADEWGLVVNEAMAAGLPVLGSIYSQAVEELVEDGVTGWTFRPDQGRQIDEALDRALKTPREKLEDMRLSARRRVETLTPQVVADCILRVIQHVFSTTADEKDSSPRPGPIL